MLLEELRGLSAAVGVAAFEQVQLQPVAGAGGGVDLFNFAEALAGRVEHEATIERADLHQQRLGRDQPVQVRDVAQRVQAGRDLTAANVAVAHAHRL